MWPILLLLCLKSHTRAQRIKVVNSAFQNLIHLYADCIYENHDMTSRYNTASCSSGKDIFRNNHFHDYTDNNGGAGINIGSGENNILEFVNNRFNNINGASGTAICLKAKKVDIIGNTFSNLHSSGNSAVYCENNPGNVDFTLTGNTFKSITSVDNGGGICFGIADITFNGANNTFDTVSSDKNGGGMNFEKVTTITATFRNDTFIRANSNFGGGIRFNCKDGNIYMYDCYFEDCTGRNSNEGGGALALDLTENGATYSAYLFGLTFNNVKGGTASVMRMWPKENTMKIIISKSGTRNCTIQDIDNSPLFYIAPASFEISWTSIMRTKGTIFRNPDKDGVKFTMESCTLENCQETGNGLFQQKWYEIYIKDTILDNCQKIFSIENNHLMSFLNTIFRNIPNQECTHAYSSGDIYNWSYVNCEFDNSQYYLKIDPRFMYSDKYQLVYSNCRFYRMLRAHKVFIESWGLFKNCVSYDCPMFEIQDIFRKIVVVNCSGTNGNGPIISILGASKIREDNQIEDCSLKVESGNALLVTVSTSKLMTITNCKFEGESQDPSLVINGKVKLEGCTFGSRRKYKRAIKFDGGQLAFSLTSLNCIPISFNKTFEVSTDNWRNIVGSDNIAINRWDTSNNLCYDDSLTKTETVQFSESIQFTNSIVYTNSIAYTNSNEFHASNDFSRSSAFIKTGNFLMTNELSVTNAFISTNDFTRTPDFTTVKFSSSISFTESNDFLMSKVFSYSNDFINTKEFQATSSFKETNKFTETSLFSITQEFINSKEFSISAHFDSSKTLSKSNLFSYSKEMQETNIFSSTNEFYESISFSKSVIFIQTQLLSESSLFSQSMQVSHSEKFLETNQFSLSQLMSNSNAYSSSVLFSNVIESSEAESSNIYDMYRSSNQEVITTTFHDNGLDSSIKLDKSDIESLTVTSTLRLSSIDHNIYGSSLNQHFQSITTDTKTESPVIQHDSSENEYISSLLKENFESSPTKDEQIYESSHISQNLFSSIENKERYESVETTLNPDHLAGSSLRDNSKLEMSSNHIEIDDSSEAATNEFNDYTSLEKIYSSSKQDSQNIFVSEKTTEELKTLHDSYSSKINGATSLEANEQTSEGNYQETSKTISDEYLTSSDIQTDISSFNSHEEQSIDKSKSVENSTESSIKIQLETIQTSNHKDMVQISSDQTISSIKTSTCIYDHHTSKDNLQSSELNNNRNPSSEHVNDEHQSSFIINNENYQTSSITRIEIDQVSSMYDITPTESQIEIHQTSLESITKPMQSNIHEHSHISSIEQSSVTKSEILNISSLEANKEEKSSFISDDRYETTKDVTLKQTVTCEKSSEKRRDTDNYWPN